LAIYFDWPTGAATTEHFIAKSRNAGQVYEWSNYRLTCLGPNRLKNRFDDVIDPFTMRDGTFHLNFADGGIDPNPDLPPDEKKIAQRTIDRLKLDDPETRRMRCDHWQDYLQGHVDSNYLMRHSPFVWYEARRQGLLTEH
jgi:hypothetical protein